MNHNYPEEYGDITADFDCTPYPVKENVSAWIFRLRDTTIGSNIIERNYKSLSIFPNPVNDKVLIELPEQHQNIEIQIFDRLGQEVTRLKALPQQTQVLWDVRYILSGVYFYQTEISGVVYRGKIIVN